MRFGTGDVGVGVDMLCSVCLSVVLLGFVPGRGKGGGWGREGKERGRLECRREETRCRVFARKE